MISRAVFLVIFLTNFVNIQGAARNTVTNEDIRDAILQVVKVVKTTEDKLERHEFRERVLGDSLKKGLVIIEKRIKTLDPLKGAFTRLDERLAAVESVLLQKDEREKNHLQKTFDVVDDIHKNLPSLLEKVKNEIIDEIRNSQQPPAQMTEPPVSKKIFEKLEKELISKVDQVSKSLSGVEKQLGNLRNDNKGILDMNNKSSESLEKVKRQLNSSESLLQKYEDKLSEFNKIAISTPENDDDDRWKKEFLDDLKTQQTQISRILSDVQNVSRLFSIIPDKREVESMGNMTMRKLEELKQLASRPTGISDDLSKTIKEIKEELENNHSELNGTLTDLTEVSSALASSIPASYDQIKNDINSLNRLEQVMMQTADNVLDTKRRVEYGVHQILADVSNKIKDGGKDVIDSVNERFETFETSILDEENGALANLTSKIGEEIDQVWRQIGIMHQQMTASTDTLNKLQNQTDSYVNGSLKSMDSMKGKVGQVNTRMEEVDENLNYLLGKLSMVSQEFNMIKSGLGKALEDIKNSFKSVEQEVKDVGPGPHKISSNEVAGN
ncbi:unnamed protein product [Brassicogethes aeneus]|uniref:Uncharacterized protein n=1 Tax=Brassicogethes aeneus TaxID=1431903 RepID=A0A9P0FNM8_BRAAE|nr:unnamed protein product [Brassicogethes aeneus]